MMQQARFFLSTVGTDLDLYVADHEDAAVSLDELKKFLWILFMLTGKRAVIYSGHVLKEQIGSTKDKELARHRLWLAHYTKSAPTWPKTTWPEWWLWQYTEQGTCAGFNGNVDLNRYDGTADQLRADWIGAAAPVA